MQQQNGTSKVKERHHTPTWHLHDRHIDDWAFTQVVNYYILSSQMLHAAGMASGDDKLTTEHQTLHRPA